MARVEQILELKSGIWGVGRAGFWAMHKGSRTMDQGHFKSDLVWWSRLRVHDPSTTESELGLERRSISPTKLAAIRYDAIQVSGVRRRSRLRLEGFAQHINKCEPLMNTNERQSVDLKDSRLLVSMRG